MDALRGAIMHFARLRFVPLVMPVLKKMAQPLVYCAAKCDIQKRRQTFATFYSTSSFLIRCFCSDARLPHYGKSHPVALWFERVHTEELRRRLV